MKKLFILLSVSLLLASCNKEEEELPDLDRIVHLEEELSEDFIADSTPECPFEQVIIEKK